MSTYRLVVRIARESLRYPVRLACGLISLVGLGAAQLALPWIVKEWVEGPLTHGDLPVGKPVLVSLVIVLLIAFFLFASRAFLASVNQRTLEHLRGAAVGRVLRLEPATMARLSTGDVMSRVFQDAGLLSGLIEGLLKRVAGDGFLLLGALFMMFVLDLRLAIATCVVAPLVGYLLIALGHVIRRLGTVAQQRMGGLNAILQEQLQGFSTIKGYQTEEFECERFSTVNRGYRQTVVRAILWSAVLVASVFAIAATSFVAAVWYGTLQVEAGRITAGGLLAFCLYAGQTIEPLRRLAETQGLLQRSLAAADRLFEILDLPLSTEASAEPPQTHEISDRSAGGVATTRVYDGIRLEHVHFRYQADLPLLEGIDLEVQPGERLAVVAASGEGKTTLTSLLLRFRDPLAGRILLDDVDLQDYTLAKLRRLICVVEQKTFLFSGPLRDNLRYGSWDAAPEALQRAVQLCGLAPLVESLPKGLDTSLQEQGADLSGGQRQRVALARAFLRDPAVLVLDEATSALDSEAEAEIFSALDSWLAERTVIVMAHRFSTIRQVSRIVVIAEGVVADDGPLDHLLRPGSVFNSLFGEQLKVVGRGGPGSRFET